VRRQWKREATTIRDRRQQRSRIVSLRPSISREPPGQRAHACWKFCTFGSRRRASLHVGRLLNEARREREFRSRLLLHERKQHFSRSRSAAVRTMSQRVGSPRGGSRATAGACDRDRQSESTGAGARRQDPLVYAHLFLAHQRSVWIHVARARVRHGRLPESKAVAVRRLVQASNSWTVYLTPMWRRLSPFVTRSHTM